MKKYPLEAMRSLRLQKEDEAEKKLSAARVVERHAREAVVAAQKALDNYLDWNKKETERLFNVIFSKLQPIRKVVETTTQISWNRSQQATYIVALEEVQKKLQEAIRETAVCLKEQQDAYKEVWKIDKHREIWMKQEQVAEEQAEESDMEETAATMFAMRKRKL